MARHLDCAGYNLQENPDYKAIAEHLKSYESRHAGWDEFAVKIDPLLRDLMTEIFRDCRSNGFYDPRCVYRHGKQEIVFAQCVELDRNVEPPKELLPGLCYLCEKRICEGRDIKGNYTQNKDYCWHKQIEG